MAQVASWGEKYASLEDWQALLARFPRPDNSCLKTGTRVRRLATVGVGTQPLGRIGTVIGCLSYPGLDMVAYVVEWDNRPGQGVMVIETHVRALRQPKRFET